MKFEYAINLYGEKNCFVCPVAFCDDKYYIFESHKNKVLRFFELSKEEIQKYGGLLKSETQMETEVGKKEIYGFLFDSKVKLFKINEMAKYLQELKSQDNLSAHTKEEIELFLSDYREYIRKRKAKLEKKKAEQTFEL